MRLKNLLLSSVVSLCITVPAYANNIQFNQNDLQTFNETNTCINCDLTTASLEGNHSQANLTGTNLQNANGNNMNLSQSNLQNTNFTYGTFILTNFSEADFTGANLSKADFSFANLYKAKISAAQLSQLKSVCRAILPDGSLGTCN